MNNKGFAITGVLYTVLVLFLLILVSILIGLNSTNDLAKKSIESLEDDYTFSNEDNPTGDNLTNAPCTGKYVFSKIEISDSGDSISSNEILFSYLKEGVDIPDDSGKLIRIDCFQKN